MKKRKTASAVITAALVLLAAGCGQSGGSWETEPSGIYIGRDGHVESAIVSTAEQANELYDREELAAYIGEALDAYNAEHEESVEMKSCSLKNGTGKAVFTYPSPEAFVSFSAETGDDTHSVTALTVEQTDQPKKGCIRVTVTGTAVITTEGKILETSDEGVAVQDAHTAVTNEGEHYIVFK